MSQTVKILIAAGAAIVSAAGIIVGVKAKKMKNNKSLTDYDTEMIAEIASDAAEIVSDTLWD